LLFGFSVGIVFATIEFLYEKYIPKKIPIGVDIIISTVIYFIVIILLANFTIELEEITYEVSLNNERGWWKKDKTFWTMILYMMFASLTFSFIKIANEKFGKGVFLKMLSGKYKVPKEEIRIFMFLDLKSSTTYAEQIGHKKYSQLIQDCFYDLNEIVPNYDAEIYQYVGDEAVLSWPYKKGLVNNNCLNLFFAFQQKLQSKSKYYLSKYDVLPEFKAGIHGGVLMVTEVGVVKKELAYHGDVINTSARIQGECNIYKVPVLISEELLNDLIITSNFTSKFLGKVLLKGKQKEINIYTIDQL
jgi:adenylate cyclase